MITARQRSVRRVLEEFSEVPFSWGERDCCQFAGAVYAEISGLENPAKAFDYDDALGAEEFMFKAGGLSELVSKTLELEISQPHELEDGDLVFVRATRELELLGIRAGGLAICLTTPAGFVRVAPRYIVHGWRIPCQD